MRPVPAPFLDRAFALEVIQRTVERRSIATIVQEVTTRLPAPAQTLVFGGVLRNSVLSEILHKPFPVRDLDFVVFGLATDEELYRAFALEQPRRNSFGGAKLSVSGITVDVWRAELELRIAGQPPQVTNIEDFLKCVTLTTDAVLYDPPTATLYEQGFLNAMSQRMIDLGADSLWVSPWKPYHLAHLAYVHRLTGFRISDRARACAREAASQPVIEEAVQYLESRGKCTNPRAAVVSVLNKM